MMNEEERLLELVEVVDEIEKFLWYVGLRGG